MVTPSRTWFRLYSEMLSDRKLDRIAKITGLTRLEVTGGWVGLLCLASDSPIRGSLLLTPDLPWTAKEMADELRCDPDVFNGLLEAFISFYMVYWDNDVLMISHWDKRQFESDSSTERVRAHREKQKDNNSSNVSVTLQEQSCHAPCNAPEHSIAEHSIADTEQSRDKADGNSGANAPAPAPTNSAKSKSKSNRKPHSEAALYLEARGHVRLRDVQCEEIDKNVIEPEDLEDWKESVDAWLLSSSRNPTNVVGILDWFREGIPDHARPGYKPGKPGNNGYGPQNDTRTDPSKYARGIPENLQAKPKPKELTPADEAWHKVCVELRGQLTKATYAANVEPLTAVGLEGGVLSIRAPTEIVERIHDRFGAVFERTAKQAGLSQIVIS